MRESGSRDPGSNPGGAISSQKLFKHQNIFLYMAIGVAVFIMVIAIVVIYVLIEVKRLRHKIFAIFLIALILFSYLSVAFIFRDQDIDLKTIPGVIIASRLYFSWLGNIFVNFKQITTKAIQMDWGTNETAEDFGEKPIFGSNKK